MSSRKDGGRPSAYIKDKGRAPRVFVLSESHGYAVAVTHTHGGWKRYCRTLYGARMAAKRARVDYAPGGRLYAVPWQPHVWVALAA